MRRISQDSLKILVILKNDSKNLFSRIKNREKEYLLILSLKRTREHFKEIFSSHYKTITIESMKLLSEDLIIALDEFYNEVEKLNWYLSYSNDLPATMNDSVRLQVRSIETKYELLALYIEAEMDDEQAQKIDVGIQDGDVISIGEDIDSNEEDQ